MTGAVAEVVGLEEDSGYHFRVCASYRGVRSDASSPVLEPSEQQVMLIMWFYEVLPCHGNFSFMYCIQRYLIDQYID